MNFRSERAGSTHSGISLDLPSPGDYIQTRHPAASRKALTRISREHPTWRISRRASLLNYSFPVRFSFCRVLLFAGSRDWRRACLALADVAAGAPLGFCQKASVRRRRRRTWRGAGCGRRARCRGRGRGRPGRTRRRGRWRAARSRRGRRGRLLRCRAVRAGTFLLACSRRRPSRRRSCRLRGRVLRPWRRAGADLGQAAARLQDQQRGGPGAVGVEEPAADRRAVAGELLLAPVRQRVVAYHVRALGENLTAERSGPLGAEVHRVAGATLRMQVPHRSGSSRLRPVAGSEMSAASPVRPRRRPGSRGFQARCRPRSRPQRRMPCGDGPAEQPPGRTLRGQRLVGQQPFGG